MSATKLYQRKGLFIRLPIALLALAAMAWVWIRFFPLPPTQIALSSGSPEGVYHAHGQRYVEIFARHGITLAHVASEGSVENLRRLRGEAEPPVQLAFIQGGAGSPIAPSTGARLQTIARVDVEPVWIFSRVPGIDSLLQLQGQRVSLGPAASGTRQLATVLLDQMRMTPADIVDSTLAGTPLVQAMRAGSLDAAIVVAAADAPVVRALLQTPGVQLVQLGRSAALLERLPYLQARLLPAGALDPGARLPPRDVSVLITTSSLVARDDLHPALQRLAAAAALEVHSAAGPFHHSGEFPSTRRPEFPAAPEARRTLAQGLSWTERELPLWWGQVLQRVVLICLPIALLAWWVARLVPAYLHWLLESRLVRWYGTLKYIEEDLARNAVAGIQVSRHIAELYEMERRMNDFQVPRDLMPRYFALRQHIDFVRAGLRRRSGR